MNRGMTIAHYEVLERLGSGGMGEVYRARDTRLGREVAIKSVPASIVADERSLARFRHEARVLAAVSHPYIATVHGLEEKDGQPYLVMELVHGHTLAQLLSSGAMSVTKALHLAHQVAEAMAAAHGKGALHRDLKPANVMVTEDGKAKVLDFGLAKLIGAAADGENDSLTTGGRVVGTAPYMSPEQVRGYPVDEHTDVWSFGVLLFQMLTGSSPFQRHTSADTISAILSFDPDFELLPGDLPPAGRELLVRCLAKDVGSRLAGFGPVVAMLEAALGMSASLTPTSAPPGLARPVSSVGSTASGTEAVLQTLVVSDLVGSTSLVERLGDRRAAELMQRHDELARRLLSAHEGLEIDKTDGFLFLFTRPINGVLYALDYHGALAELSVKEGVVLEARVGVHLGEVILHRNTPDAVSRGAKPLEVEGLAKPTAARLMSAAIGGQTLLTRGAYDVAIRGAVGLPGADKLEWRHHGAYRFKGVENPVDVFEVGFAGIAPLTPPPDTGKVQRSDTSIGVSAPVAVVRPHRLSWWVGVAVFIVAIAGGLAVWRPWKATLPDDARTGLAAVRSLVAVPSGVVGAADDAHLGEAVSRTLSGELIKLPGLAVKAPPSAVQADQLGGDIDKMGEAYEVDAVVTSTIVASRDDLTLDVQIVGVGTDALLYSGSFQGTRAAFVPLVKKVAAGVAAAIRPGGDDALRGTASTAPTIMPELELDLRRADFLKNRYNHQHVQSDFDSAKALYEDLLARDPSLAEAATELGNLHNFRYEAMGRQEDRGLAAVWAKRSLAIRPTPRALAAHSWARMLDGDAPLSLLPDLLAANQGAPDDEMVSITLATVLGLGAHGLGVAGQAHTSELAPLYLYPWVNKGQLLIAIGREEDALDSLAHALSLEPQMPHALMYRTVALTNLGRSDEAAASYEQVLALPPGALPESTLEWLKGIVELADATRRGDTAAANEAARVVITEEFEIRDCVATTLHRQRRTREILEFLALLGDAPDKSLPWDLLVTSPGTAPLLDAPEMQKLLASAKAAHDAQLAVLDAAEARGSLPSWLSVPLADLRAVGTSH